MGVFEDSPPGRPNRQDQQMSCKVCGCVMGYDFSVPDLYWNIIVPEHLRERVICAGCFHNFALVKKIARFERDILG